jgi:hypothetical protein
MSQNRPFPRLSSMILVAGGILFLLVSLFTSFIEPIAGFAILLVFSFLAYVMWKAQVDLLVWTDQS